MTETNLTFEEAMKRLEEITNLLQKNDCTLDESLKLYEEGLQLSAFCDQKLSAFNEKLAELVKENEEENA